MPFINKNFLMTITIPLFLMLLSLISYYNIEIYGEKLGEIVDTKAFFFFNGLLSHSHIFRVIVATLNHRWENKISILIMLIFNATAVLSAPRNEWKKRIRIIIFFWIGLELSIALKQQMIKFLHITRDSPNFVLKGIKLSEIFANSHIKDRSADSFPSGHSFVIAYFILSQTYVRGKIHKLEACVAFLWFFPRIISGAHWLSDVLFGIFMGWFFCAIVAVMVEKFTGYSRNIGRKIGNVGI